MPETLSIVAKVPPGSYPPRNVIKKGLLIRGLGLCTEIYFC